MAFDRMLTAPDLDVLKIEITNALQHTYQLGEALKLDLSLTNASLNAELIRMQAKGSMGALWIRGADTHDAVTVSEMSNRVSEYLERTVGTLSWRPLADVIRDSQKSDSNLAILRRHDDYRDFLADQPVNSTLRRAFDDLNAVT